MSSGDDCGNEDVSFEALLWHELLARLGVNKQAHEIESSDITGKAFPSLNAWASFYFAYSRWKGFSVRHDKVRKDDNGILCMRRWVCSRQGYRDKKWIDHPSRIRKPRALTRIGCRACLTICVDKDTNQWVATTFVAEHNHELASPSELHFLRSNRSVPDSMVAQAKTLRQAGIRTMSILDFMSMQCGGRDRLPFLKKDFYNRLAKQRNDIGSETDSEGALGYLTCLAIRDGNFYCKFNVDDDDRLHTIFWADGTSRKDYQTFGDVIAFDTTYRTNAYNKPLLIIVGVNHHFRTTVYAVALLPNETAGTYIWVLQQFLDCMDRKHPKTVVTDGDPAMHSAIITVFPDAIHRLCAWHLDTNAGSNIPSGEFEIQFNKLMYKFYSEVEFEEQWRKVVDDHNLQQNEWAISMYAKRKNWAETFLRGNFFGGMRTTQRCESMNSYMRRFLHSKHLLRDFVSQIDQGIQNIRYTEAEDDFKAKHTEPFIPTNDPLRVYYQQFASACTPNIYQIIAKQIDGQNSYSVSSSDYTTGLIVFRLSRFQFGEIRHAVHYFQLTNRLICTCMLLETDGIPCRHIFTVMKHLSIHRIPDSLIRPCWRKDAKATLSPNPSFGRSEPDVLHSYRFGTLASDFNDLALYACKYDDTYLEARQQFKSMTENFKNVFTLRDNESAATHRDYEEGIASSNNVIKDPLRAKTKGREKEHTKLRHQQSNGPSEPHRKRCRICNELGHNRATCKKRQILKEPTLETSSIHEPHLNDTSFSQLSASAAGLDDHTNFSQSFNTNQISLSQENFRGPMFCMGESSQQQKYPFSFQMDNDLPFINSPDH